LQVRDAVPAGTGLTYRLCKPVDSPAERTYRAGNLRLYCAFPEKPAVSSFPWSHNNGGEENTQGIRLRVSGEQGEFITVLYPSPAGTEPPAMSPLPGGVKVGEDEVRFAGGLDQDPATTYVAVSRAGKVLLALTGKEINLDRPQGDIGLFVPNTGYPFGDIPDWLIRQRLKPPAWYQPVIPLGYRQK
jgi:hypothetical protein